MLASSSRNALKTCSRNARAASSPRYASSVPGGSSTKQHRNTLLRPPSPSPSHTPTGVFKFPKHESLFRIKRGARCTESNIAMRDFLARAQPHRVLEQACKMKAAKVKPDVTTYNCVLNALALLYWAEDAWAVLRDMQAFGVLPDAGTFNQLLYAHSSEPSSTIFQILSEMSAHGIHPNARTYDFIIKYYLECANLEMALCKLAEMNDWGFSPSLKVAQMLIDSAGRVGHARLALDLADAYEDTTVRKLDSETWVHLLICSAEQLYADGVMRAWAKVVTSQHILLDTGLLQLVLHTAARHGLPGLAADAIRQLEASGIKLAEHHFAPLIEAFVRSGGGGNNDDGSGLKEAFSVLELMRVAHAAPTLESTDSIFERIRHDPEALDSGYAALETLHKENKKVDVVAANVLLKACAEQRDLQRAIGIYKSLSSFSLKPDVQTFEQLLKTCLAARHVELGTRLFREMSSPPHGLKPSAKCFERLILLVLTQRTYEDAFFYLEEMKSSGYTPSYSLYEAIVRKCVGNKDGRWKLAVEEMRQMGYGPMKERLRVFVESGGREWREVLSEEERLPWETRRRMKALREKRGRREEEEEEDV